MPADEATSDDLGPLKILENADECPALLGHLRMVRDAQGMLGVVAGEKSVSGRWCAGMINWRKSIG